jgi:hypothetical protein
MEDGRNAKKKGTSGDDATVKAYKDKHHGHDPISGEKDPKWHEPEKHGAANHKDAHAKRISDVKNATHSDGTYESGSATFE